MSSISAFATSTRRSACRCCCRPRRAAPTRSRGRPSCSGTTCAATSGWRSTEQSVDDKTQQLHRLGRRRPRACRRTPTPPTRCCRPACIGSASPRRATPTRSTTSCFVAAQAATATFVDQGNDPDFLATPLPAGTIAKLKAADPAIKKIVQPYTSFGGQAARERRALLLRAPASACATRTAPSPCGTTSAWCCRSFPSVYRVKCINHTELMRDAAEHDPRRQRAEARRRAGGDGAVCARRAAPAIRSAPIPTRRRWSRSTASCASACRRSCGWRCRTRSSRRCRSSSRSRSADDVKDIAFYQRRAQQGGRALPDAVARTRAAPTSASAAGGTSRRSSTSSRSSPTSIHHRRGNVPPRRHRRGQCAGRRST